MLQITQRRGVDSTFKLPTLNQNTKRPKTENVTEKFVFSSFAFCSQFNSFRWPYSFWGNLRESSLFSATWEYSLIHSFELNLYGVFLISQLEGEGEREERERMRLKFKKQTTKKYQLFYSLFSSGFPVNVSDMLSLSLVDLFLTNFRFLFLVVVCYCCCFNLLRSPNSRSKLP